MRAAGRPLLALAILLSAAAQDAPAPPEVLRFGPGMTPPQLLKQVEPDYSEEGRAAGIQGNVVLEIVIDEKGLPLDITVLSPLGFGLDEKAIQAVQGWRFKPAEKDGVPVRVLAHINVRFRFLDRRFEEYGEARRTAFNAAIQTLRRPAEPPESIANHLQSLQKLARDNYPPAQYEVGVMLLNGEHLAVDVPNGIRYLEKAARQNFPAAVHNLASRYLDGRDVAQDLPRGIKEMKRAARLGSTPAQIYLGGIYERGDGVEVEPGEARRYFRLCAARNIAACQFLLASLLLQQPNRRERDYLQAVALLQLAAAQGHPESSQLAARETPKLSISQQTAVDDLKSQIVSP
jgi:TonB family protein